MESKSESINLRTFYGPIKLLRRPCSLRGDTDRPEDRALPQVREVHMRILLRSRKLNAPASAFPAS